MLRIYLLKTVDCSERLRFRKDNALYAGSNRTLEQNITDEIFSTIGSWIVTNLEVYSK